MCYSRQSMLVHTPRFYSKSARIIFGVLCLLCTDQIVSACSRPAATLVDQLASATNTQSDSSQAGAAKFPTHRPPRSNNPHFVEVASVPTSKHLSCEPQQVHQLAAGIIKAFELELTHQPAGRLLAPSGYSSVIVPYSSGRSPPRQG